MSASLNAEVDLNRTFTSLCRTLSDPVKIRQGCVRTSTTGVTGVTFARQFLKNALEVANARVSLGVDARLACGLAGGAWATQIKVLDWNIKRDIGSNGPNTAGQPSLAKIVNYVNPTCGSSTRWWEQHRV